MSRVPAGGGVEGSIDEKWPKAESVDVGGARREYEIIGTVRRTAMKRIVPRELPPYCPRKGKKSMGSGAGFESLEAMM